MAAVACSAAAALSCGSVASTSTSDAGNNSPDGATSDGGTDTGGGADAGDASAAPGPCDPSAPFTNIVAATALSAGSVSTDGVAFTSDGLTAYVSSNRTGTVGGFDIFVSTRSSTTAAWGALTSLPNVNTASQERSPVLTPDGLTLFFYSDRGGSGYDIYSSTRPSLISDFGAAATVAMINSTGRDDTGSITADGQTLYFDSDRSGTGRIYRATLGASGTFMTPQEVPELDSGGTGNGGPVISADGLTVYFGRVTSGDPEDVYVAHRTSVADGFGTPTAVTELSSTALDFPVWLAPDNCTLYFGSSRNGGSAYGLYTATRTPH
jgi:Tol biopolymer transport system component